MATLFIIKFSFEDIAILQKLAVMNRRHQVASYRHLHEPQKQSTACTSADKAGGPARLRTRVSETVKWDLI
jgi:hypothetical protein